MPQVTDHERRKWYLNAFQNWEVDGYVTFEEQARNWIRKELSAYSDEQLAELLFLHVQKNGCSCVDEQPETREHWRDLHEFHHDLRVRIDGRVVYFETRLLILRRTKDSIISVVNVHDS